MEGLLTTLTLTGVTVSQRTAFSLFTENETCEAPGRESRSCQIYYHTEAKVKRILVDNVHPIYIVKYTDVVTCEFI